MHFYAMRAGRSCDKAIDAMRCAAYCFDKKDGVYFMEENKKRVLLSVSYDGTNYCGWQIQPNGRTIEGELNYHLSALLGEEIHVIGASRTDAGVHARCNLAVFDTLTQMPAEKISFALNQRLPQDIRIQKSQKVCATFHPRKIHTKKTYEYRIYNARFPNPLERLYSHFIYVPLDVDRMQKAAAYFVGEHDFMSFSTFKPEVQSTVRTITDFTVEKSGQMILVRVCGNGFLYNMVRILVGTLIEVGRGRIEPESMEEMLGAKKREAAGPTAPAVGLTLAKYEIDGMTLL